MDRWPAAAFKARCVPAEALDRLWHLVSTAIQRYNLESQQQRGAENDYMSRDVEMGKGSRKVTGDIWNRKVEQWEEVEEAEQEAWEE